MENFIKYFATPKHFIIYLSLIFMVMVAWTADPRGDHRLLFAAIPLSLLAIIALTYLVGRSDGVKHEAAKFVTTKDTNV